MQNIKYLYVTSLFLKFLYIFKSLLAPLFLLLIFQSCCRCLFHFFQNYSEYNINYSLFSQSLLYGLYMDLSICSAAGILIAFTYILQIIIQRKISSTIPNYIVVVFLLLLTIVYSFDAILYKEWRFRLDDSILLYLERIKEASHFVAQSNTINFILCLICLLFLSFIVLNILRKNYFEYPISFTHSFIYIILAGLLIVPLRGGIGLAPLSPSWAYHSNNLYANHLSINPFWNFLYTWNQNSTLNKDYRYLDDDEATQVFENISKSSDTSEFTFINTLSPDILLVFLESFTANFINSYHKNYEITARLNQWIKKGVYFDHAYSSGDRTDKGLPAVLSAYPSQPKTSIIKYSNKSDHLGSLAEVLHKNNYSSYFYYGGDILFAGMKSYLLANGFDNIKDKTHFNSSSYNAKWGVHDHLLFQNILQDLPNLSSPFLLGVLTLSSHPPYDIPIANIFEPKNNEDRFVLSAMYADSSLGSFLDQIYNSDRWKNLLVILVADHGAHYPDSIKYHQKEKFRIPLLFTGGAVTKDTTIHTLCSQTDIAATLLSQLKIPNPFIFSKNILTPNNRPFAFYSFNNGMGWIDDHCYSVFSHDSKSSLITEGQCESSQKYYKAYYQKLMKDFSLR